MGLRNAASDIRTIHTLLTGAEAEAHRAGEPAHGAEHLLLSALELPDGSARRAFARIGVDPEQFRTAIAQSHASALASVGVHASEEETAARILESKGPMRGQPSGEAAFQAAVKLAKTDKSKLLGAHVVIAVAQAEYGTAARALKAMGVDRAALIEAARSELASSS